MTLPHPDPFEPKHHDLQALPGLFPLLPSFPTVPRSETISTTMEDGLYWAKTHHLCIAHG